MEDHGYKHDFDRLADILGAATLLASRRKCQLDLEILKKEDPDDFPTIIRILAMQAHAQALIEQFPEDVVAEATHVVEWLLTRME